MTARRAERMKRDAANVVMLRRAAKAVRNAQRDETGDLSWIEWVPTVLDRMADETENEWIRR